MRVSNKVNCESFHLYKEGKWEGQIILTEDGMFSAFTDWGNFSYVWRHYGENFKDFLIGLDVSYFSGKIELGVAYQGKLNKGAARKFSEKILPLLQEYLVSEKELVKP